MIILVESCEKRFDLFEINQLVVQVTLCDVVSLAVVLCILRKMRRPEEQTLGTTKEPSEFDSYILRYRSSNQMLYQFPLEGR